MISPRPNLHTLRETLGLTMGNVETASEQLARKHNNEEYLITTSRLSDFETKVVIPGIHRLYSLAIIDRREFGEMLSWYGVDLNQTAFRPRNQCATANPFFSCASKHHGDKDAGADRCQFRSAHNIEFRSHDRAVGHGSSGISAAVIKEGLQLRVHWQRRSDDGPHSAAGQLHPVDGLGTTCSKEAGGRSASGPSTSSRPGRAIPAAGVHSRVRNSSFRRTRCPLRRQGFFLRKRRGSLGRSLGWL